MECPGIAETLRLLMPVNLVLLGALVAWLPFEIARTIRARREQAAKRRAGAESCDKPAQQEAHTI